MISIPAHQCLQILLMPFVKQRTVVTRLFSLSPTIESFIHHQKSHFIRQFQQFRSRYVMRGPEGITSETLQDLQLTFQSYHINSCSQCPQIMMITGTLYLYTFPVQQKAVVVGKLYGAETKRNFISIHQIFSIIHLYPSQITVGSFQTPTFGRKDSQRNTILCRSICRKIQPHMTTRSDFPSGLIIRIQLVH